MKGKQQEYTQYGVHTVFIKMQGSHIKMDQRHGR